MDMSQARQAMVEEQLKSRSINDERVLAALATVPRERFVPANLQHYAYNDQALPIAAGQTISQPYIVALMAQALGLKGNERILEVGAGSGYAAAILAELGTTVITLERHPELAAAARAALADLGYAQRVAVVVADGSLGWTDAAPYDAISVPAGAPAVPQPLLEQLADGGRLVIPVGPEGQQRLLRYRRISSGQIAREDLGAVRFVPLIGAAGWDDPAQAP